MVLPVTSSIKQNKHNQNWSTILIGRISVLCELWTTDRQTDRRLTMAIARQPDRPDELTREFTFPYMLLWFLRSLIFFNANKNRNGSLYTRVFNVMKFAMSKPEGRL